MQVLEQLQHLDDARFFAIYETMVEQGFGPLDREVALALKFRPQAIRKLPLEQRARRARSILARKNNAELTYELFGSYLMKKSRDLITEFLDATGVKHDEGMIEDVDAAQPKGEDVAKAVETLDEKYGADDVTLYLSMCAMQWPEVKELDEIWRGRAEAVSS